METKGENRHELRHGYVPVDPFLPYIDRFCTRQNALRHTRESRSESDSMVIPGMALLSMKAKVSRRRLYDITKGVNRSMRFDTADKLMCAMEIPHLWREDPTLREIYESVKLS